ncbi:MAG: hypothetical protein ACI85O_003227 [Saprospiraceae bacterium]|jgi:hypothetical protein
MKTPILKKGILNITDINPTTLCSNTTSSILTVHALPIVSLISSVDTVLITDTPFALSGTPGGGLFQGNGINSGGVFDPAIAGIGSHNIIYSFIDNNGCTNESMVTIVVVQMTSISDLSIESTLKISPNPFINHLTITTEESLTEPIGIKIYDLLGHQIFYKKTTIQNNLTVNTQDFPTGILMIQLQTEKGSHTFKSIKME